MTARRSYAIGYARRSTPSQVNSLGRQSNQIFRYAEQHRLHVLAVFCDTQSGCVANRPGFAAALPLLARPDVKDLVVETDDRLTREGLLAGWHLHQLLTRLGVTLHWELKQRVAPMGPCPFAQIHPGLRFGEFARIIDPNISDEDIQGMCAHGCDAT